jgi:hypothetical protein
VSSFHTGADIRRGDCDSCHTRRLFEAKGRTALAPMKVSAAIAFCAFRWATRPDHAGEPRPEISFSQGDKWNALINRYITVIPPIGDETCIAMQSMSGRSTRPWLVIEAYAMASLAFKLIANPIECPMELIDDIFLSVRVSFD